MKVSRTDLHDLRWSLLAFVASLFSAGSAIWMSDEYLTRTLLQLRTAQQQVDAARAELFTTQDDLDNISGYAAEYASLQERNIAADEQRLDWIEEMEKLRRRFHLSNLKYTIAPQQAYASEPPPHTGNLNINHSSLHLQTDLLHEMQLVDFFAALRSAKQGYFIIHRCELERTGTNDETAPQLKADCTGGWVTLMPGGAS